MGQGEVITTMTVRMLGGIALIVAATTAMCLAPAFASRGVSPPGSMWAAIRVPTLPLTVATFFVATWGLIAMHPWWEAVAISAAALGLITVATFWIAPSESGTVSSLTSRAFGYALMVAGVIMLLFVGLERLVARPASTSDGRVLWDGGFESGGVPHGTGADVSCGTGSADGPDSLADQYAYVQEMGNTACTSRVAMVGDRVRTADSTRSLKIVMGAYQQREQPASKYGWTPDDRGTVDQWYGFSMFYDSDWNEGGGIAKEVSATNWHSPAGFRRSGENGSMNFSGDMNMNNANGKAYASFSEPHLILRRNTVLNQQGFYKDGLGLDKLDLGPIVAGEWMDIVCHVRWSTTATNALRECWRDGVYKGARTSLNAVAEVRHVLRLGQYQETNIAHTRTTYYDNARIGTSYDAVDPSR